MSENPTPETTEMGGQAEPMVTADQSEVTRIHNTVEGDNYGSTFNAPITAGDDANFGPTFNNNIYQQTADVIQATLLGKLISEDSVEPTDIEPLVEKLTANHAILLVTPEYWGHQHVAAQLAKRMLMKLKHDNAAVNQEKLWKNLGDTHGDAILKTLDSRSLSVDESAESEDESSSIVKNTVLYISDVSPGKYTPEIINKLCEYGKEYKVYIILTSTTLTETWLKNLGANNPYTVDVAKNSPYKPEDLATWAAKKNDVFTALQEKQAIADESLLHEKFLISTELKNIDGAKDLLELVTKVVHSPGTVQKLHAEIRKSDPIKNLIQHIRKATQEQDKRLEQWFAELKEDERYMVLTIGLVNNLPEQTFWAIYEHLIRDYWRVRNQTLEMRDYFEIERSLSEFIQTDNGQIGFRDSDARSKIINDYALKKYRRSLVNALPFIAELLTSADTPLDNLSGTIQAMEIWGSDLATQPEIRNRRHNLRSSLIASIVDIDAHEPITTEYILQSWAERPFYQDFPLYVVNRSLREAFTDVIFQMYQRDPFTSDSDYWSIRSFNLLRAWYSTLQRETFADIKELIAVVQVSPRRQQIRQTLAYTLCVLGKLLTPNEFGSLKDTSELFKAAPARQPEAGSLKSLWHLLVALAWDLNPAVRMVIADFSINLYQKHEDNFRQLTYLLASDWSETVRLQVAYMLASLYELDKNNLQLVHHLLILPESETVSRKVDDNHYLYRESAAYKGISYPIHMWTATMALCLIEIAHPGSELFGTYLKTVLDKPNSPELAAFKAVCNTLLTFQVLPMEKSRRQAVIDRFRLGEHWNLLRRINNDRSPEHRTSLSSQALRDEINSYNNPQVIIAQLEGSSSTAQRGKQAVVNNT